LVGAHLHASVQSSSYIAAAAAIGGAEATLIWGWRSRATARAPISPVNGRRLILLVALAAGFGALDGTIPTFAAAHSSTTSRLLEPGPDVLGQSSTATGVTTTAWRFGRATSQSNETVIVTATGPSAASVLTYPTDTLLDWSGSKCPESTTHLVAGRDVSTGEYFDDAAGITWELYQWSWQTTSRFQRVTVMLALGPSDVAVPIPTVATDVGADVLRTVDLFVSNRRIKCDGSSLHLTRGLGIARFLMKETEA
jgi:hypothetical protein